VVQVHECNVKTGGRKCSRTATYEVTSTCSGCPVSHRKTNAYVCTEDLSSYVQGKVACGMCKNTRIVSIWEKLSWEKLSTPSTPVNQKNTNSTIIPERKNRIGDPQRNVVLDRLAEAFANGFLNRDEFDKRTEAVQAAVYDTDLVEITEDLSPVNAVIPQPHVRSLATLLTTPGIQLPLFIFGLLIGAGLTTIILALTFIP
jgi:hypothetical protein